MIREKEDAREREVKKEEETHVRSRIAIILKEGEVRMEERKRGKK